MKRKKIIKLKCKNCWWWNICDEGEYCFKSLKPINNKCKKFYSIKEHEEEEHRLDCLANFKYSISDKFPEESYLSRRWHNEH